MAVAEPQQLARVYFERGYKRQMRGRYVEAIACYRKSLELFPTAEAYTFLGWTYSMQGRYEEAIQECLKAIQIDPEFGNPYNDIGAYYIELRRLDEAVPWLERAIRAKRYDCHCFPHFNLGRIYEHQGHWRQAIEAYRSAYAANAEYLIALQAANRLQGLLD
ncbi:MAG: tetratricopeptide repeat protein [Candidatus Omnitrophica bacterium]|nr:tetratricopeptide repeat protein [Candidatus Omnitrophota bacterium]